MHQFIYSFIHPNIQASLHSSVHSSTQTFICPFMHSFICPFIPSLIHPIHTLIDPFIHSLLYFFIISSGHPHLLMNVCSRALTLPCEFSTPPATGNQQESSNIRSNSLSSSSRTLICSNSRILFVRSITTDHPDQTTSPLSFFKWLSDDCLHHVGVT